MLVVAAVWYVVLTTVVTVVQYYVERHYARGAVRTLPPTPVQRLRANLTAGISRVSGPRGATR
jgi:polar amino acid transport system permease protein